MKNIPPLKELRRVASKQSTNGFLNPLCDYLAFYPAKIFLYLPFNPVQITVILILIKIATALLMASGTYFLTVIALLIFQLASILDGVDGIVARYRQDYSYNGIYLDYVGHYFCNSLLLITLGIGTYNQTGNALALVIAVFSALVFLLTKAITMNGIWVSNPDMRKEMENIVYGEQFSMKSQQNRIVACITDLFLMDNPLNFMFWGVLAGYFFSNAWLITLVVYAIILTLELGRRLFLQYWRIKKHELRKKQQQRQEHDNQEQQKA